MHAVGRIAYHGWIDNIQASWVKMGVEGAKQLLVVGLQRPRRDPHGREHLPGRGREPRAADARGRLPRPRRVARAPPRAAHDAVRAGRARRRLTRDRHTRDGRGRAGREPRRRAARPLGRRANRDLLRDILVTGLALGQHRRQPPRPEDRRLGARRDGTGLRAVRPVPGHPEADHVRLGAHGRLRPALRPGGRPRRPHGARELDRGHRAPGRASWRPGPMAPGPDMSLGVEIRLPFETASHPQLAAEGRLVEMKYFFTRKLMLMKESAAFAVLPGRLRDAGRVLRAAHLAADRQGRAGADRPAGPSRRPVLGGPASASSRARWCAGASSTARTRPSTASPTTSPSPSRRSSASTATTTRAVSCGSTMVIRCRFAPTDDELAALNEEFADICTSKGIWRTGPLPPERAERDHLELKRLALEFDRRSHGRLRMLIDAINRWPEPQPEASSGARLRPSRVRAVAGSAAARFGLGHERPTRARRRCGPARATSRARGPGRSWLACRPGAAGPAASRRRRRRAARPALSSSARMASSVSSSTVPGCPVVAGPA